MLRIARHGLMLGAVLLAAACSGCATGVTGSPTEVSVGAARVGGQVVSTSGGETSYWVQHGRTTAYGSETPHQTISLTRNEARAVSVEIRGLARATPYHYRLCAADSQQSPDSPSCGQDRRLTTQSVACGETVTADVRLTGLLDCRFGGLGPGVGATGLVIGADGVTINLAGHGLLSFVAAGGGGPTGIDNSGGFDDVTVRNGGVGGWGGAIVLRGASRNRIVDVNAHGAGVAVSIQGGEANEVHASDVFGRSGGISIDSSDRFVVAGTRVSAAFFFGMTVNADLGRIVHSEISSGGLAQPGTPGVRVSGSGNRIVDNQVTGWSDGNVVLGTGTDNVIAENQVSEGDNPFGGRGDGIVVAAGALETLLRANVARDNGDDGIDVESAATRLRDNSATGNGDFGIDAVPGVTDLGGNTASGNGNPLQCRNVFCR